MDGWAALAALLLVGVLVIPPPAAPVPSAAYPVAPRLFVVTNASSAFAGDNVSVDFYSYSSGNLKDPDGPPMVYAYVGGPNPNPPLSLHGMAHVGTGHYHAWTLLPNFPNGGLQATAYSDMSASVLMAGANVTGVAFLDWILPGLYLRFYSNIATISPVQLMHLTAELYNGSQPVDADAGSVHFQAVGYLGPRAGPMAPNRTATGVYDADAVLNSSMSYGFAANATVHGILVQQALTPFGLIPAFTRPAYQAWFQTLSANSSAVLGVLWVADPWGRPAAGVTVSLGIDHGREFINAISDGQGRVPLTIDLLYGYAQIGGSVGSGGPEASYINAVLPYGACSQGLSFPGTPYVRPTDPPILPGGVLRDFLTPGATVVRGYQVVNTSANVPAAVTNAPLNYYLVGYRSGTVYAAGHGVTDAQGDVSLTFAVPPEEFLVKMDVQGLGQAWITYSVASPALGLRVSPLTLGGPTDVSVSFPPPTAPWVDSGNVFAYGSIGVLKDAGQNWTKWTGGFGCADDYLRGTRGGLNATLFLPSFLPSSARYLVDALTFSGTSVSEQFVILSPGQSADIPVGGATGLDLGMIALWAMIGIILAAIAAVGLWVVLRRRTKAPPQPPPAPPPSP